MNIIKRFIKTLCKNIFVALALFIELMFLVMPGIIYVILVVQNVVEMKIWATFLMGAITVIWAASALETFD